MIDHKTRMIFTGVLCLLNLSLCLHTVTGQERPNIVWIVVDDMSSHFGYQNEKLVKTPHVDRLAKEGIVFSRAYASAPVCSTFRSAMITGMYQTTIGAHHHRSSRGKLKIKLPESIRPIPELFREAGYFTTNADASGTKGGKEDYNFAYRKNELYDGVDYNSRGEGQPFFAQFQLRGGKIRNVQKWYTEAMSDLEHAVDRDEIKLPPYYPDHPEIREDWAQYLDSVNYTDVEVGRILQRLREDQVLDNTVVFFLTDHGISHARGKQFLYEEGILIPFVIWAPNRLEGGIVRDELISHIDLGATSLQLAGIPVPATMQGRPLFGPDARPRDYVVSARDRCDETVDRIRSIRKGNLKYIRNFYPGRPYLQPCAYKDAKPFMPVLRKLHATGQLDSVQSLHMAETRPVEELYDLDKDPWEINNLASHPSFQQQLSELRDLLTRWVMETDDQGRFAETDAMFNSDMAAYASKGLRQKKSEYFDEVVRNIELMKKWQAENR